MRLPYLALLACAACEFPKPPDVVGDAPTMPDDAGPADIDADVSNVRGTVHITVLDPAGSGAPAIGMIVAFVDRDGTLVRTASTDSNGKVDAEILPGASVTTIEPLFSGYRLHTTLAIRPGDQVIIGSKLPDHKIIGTFTLSWPDISGHATTYAVFGPCGNVGTTVFDVNGSSPTAPTTLTFGVAEGCAADSTEFLVAAGSGLPPNSRVFAFNDSSSVPFSAGKSFTMDYGWNALTFSASYTNVNVSSIASITSDRLVPDGGRPQPISMPASDPTTIAFGGLPKGVSARVISTFRTASDGRIQTLRQKLPGDATTYGVDVGRMLLAWLDTPTFDTASQKISIPKVAPGSDGAVTADLLKVSATWTRSVGAYSWDVSGPDASTVTLPNLTGAVANVQLNPAATDTVVLTAISYEADTIADYNAIRTLVDTAVTDTFEPSRSPATLVRISNSPPPPLPPGE